MRGWFTAGLVCLALSSTAQVSVAQESEASEAERAAARGLAEAGFKAFESGDYALALDRFQSAEEIYHALPHLLFMARSQEKLGRLVDARAMFKRITEETLADDAPQAFKDAQTAAAEEGPALDARIAHLTVIVSGDASRVKAFEINGVDMGVDQLGTAVDVDPGELTVELIPDAGEPTVGTIELAEGATDEIRLELKPAPVGDVSGPEEEEGGSIVPGVVVLGVGVVGVGVGAVTGLMALGKASDLNDACPENPCPTENQSLKDDAETFSTISTISFIAGGVLVAAGVTLLVIQPGGGSAEADSATVEVRLNPTGLSAFGTF